MQWELRTRRLLAQGVFYLMIAAVISVVNGEPEKQKPSTVERIPDADFVAKRGDRAMLFGYSADKDLAYTPLGARTTAAYNEYARALEIQDTAGIDELMKQGDLVRIPPKTGVLVLEIEEYPAEDPRTTAAVVRITDGPLKDHKFWVSRFEACRLVENPAYQPPLPPVAKSKPESGGRKSFEEMTPEEVKAVREGAARQMAKSYFVIAENLRRSGKYAQARKTYLEVIRDFGSHPEAKQAKERLKTLPKE